MICINELLDDSTYWKFLLLGLLYYSSYLFLLPRISYKNDDGRLLNKASSFCGLFKMGSKLLSTVIPFFYSFFYDFFSSCLTFGFKTSKFFASFRTFSP